MTETVPMDGVVAAITDEIENALAIVRETEVGDEDTTSTGTNLVTLGVDTTLANWVSEEMIQLEEGNLTGRIVQILFRLASTLSDDVLDVSSFAHKMAEKISVKLQDELKKRVQDALELAKQDTLNYLRDQEYCTLMLSSSLFYGHGEGQDEVSNLKENTFKVLYSHANANVLKVRAQWASDAVEQKAIMTAVMYLSKNPEWMDFVDGSSNCNTKTDLEEPEIDLSSGLEEESNAEREEEEPEIDLSTGLEEEIDLDNLEAISISVENETFCFKSDDWHEVGRSEPIDTLVLQEDSEAKLQFTWHDQGWGNRKGKLRIRLLDEAENDYLASSCEYGIAPHEEEHVEESYNVKHPLIAECKTGCRYVVEIIVGGGGGHSLTVTGFQFSAAPCLKKIM